MHRTTKKAEPTIRRARALRRGDNVAEALMWNELKDRQLGGHKFVRQSPIGPYFADFLCREHRLVVELDGSQHAESRHDDRRNRFMTELGFAVIRFWNDDVLRHRASVCATILAALEGRIAEDVRAADLRYFRPTAPHRLAALATSPQRGEEKRALSRGEEK